MYLGILQIAFITTEKKKTYLPHVLQGHDLVQ